MRNDRIPKFKSEDEEHEFWTMHDFGDELMERATWDPKDPLAPPRPARDRRSVKQ